MATPVRICYVNIPHFVDMNALPPNELMFNTLMSTAMEMRPALNITWVRENIFGSLINPQTFEYNGCIGSIQRNESDVGAIIAGIDYYGPKVTIWAPWYADKTIIGTMYSTDQMKKYSTHVMDFLEGYSATHWLLTISLMLVLAFLMDIVFKQKTKNKKKKRRSRSACSEAVNFAISCALNQHSNCVRKHMTFMANWLYTFMTLLTFFTAYFLTSMIKTEMVAQDPPPTIQSYQDILDKDIIPKWFDELGEHASFEFAAEGSIEKKIWDRVVERGRNRSIISLQNLVRNDPTPAWNDLMEVVEMKAVGLFQSVISRLIVTNMCALVRSEGLRPDVRAFFHADTTAKEQIKVAPGSLLTDDRIRRRVSSGLNRRMEMGTLLESIMKPYSYFLASNTAAFSKIELCIANVIDMPESHVHAVPLSHYRDLIPIVAVLLCVTIVVLLIEISLHRQRKSVVRPIVQSNLCRRVSIEAMPQTNLMQPKAIIPASVGRLSPITE